MSFRGRYKNVLACVSMYYLQIPVEGAAPEARHSHSACSYQGGVVVFGGLDRSGVPLGDTVVLRPTERGFSWERVAVQPPPVPRSVGAFTKAFTSFRPCHEVSAPLKGNKK